MDELQKDARFKHIARDPRFRKMKRTDRKVKIDKRFKGMFNDNKFRVKYTVDKRGRPINATTNENLRKFYDVSGSGTSDSETSEDEESEKNITDKKISGKDEISVSKEYDSEKKKNKKIVLKSTETISKEDKKAKVREITREELEKEDSSEESSEEEEAGSDDEDTSEEESASSRIDVAGGPDFARGEGNLPSSDEDESGDDDDESGDTESKEVEHPWGEIDRDAVKTEEASRRLAVCNMDWDRIQAADLMVLLNSFKPPGGVIKAVTIYPSEFGLQRMADEEVKGPTELVQDTDKPNQHNEAEYHREKLRKYQLNRLKYYYAVVECDSAETASHIYEQCDGIEYEGSANKIDLRFIPDDMTFDQEPKSHVTDMPDSAIYKPTRFINSALQQSKVNLTWDETDHNRVAMTMRKFTQDDLETLDVRDYLASDSDDAGAAYGDMVQGPDCGEASDNEDEETQIKKYRALLQGLDDNDKTSGKDMDMEVTWEPGLKESTQDLVKKSRKSSDQTPWEKYLEKNKEKKMQKREKKKSRKDQEHDSEEEGAISDDAVPAGVDLNDPFFAEEMQPAKDKSRKKEKKKKKKTTTGPESLEQDKDRAKLSLLMLEDEKDDKKHFNFRDIVEGEKPLKGRKKRRLRKRKQLVEEERARKRQQDDFTVDASDDRFKELYQNPLYNIDPTAPEFKKTKAMETLIEEKLRRRASKHKQKPVEDDNGSNNKPSKKIKMGEGGKQEEKDAGLASLIKSVKAKTKTVQNRKNKPRGGLG